MLATNHPESLEWRLSKLNPTVPEAQLSASGTWGVGGSTLPVGNPPVKDRRGTAMTFKLDIADAGNLLSRLGYPGVLRGGKGKMEGQVTWSGSPMNVNYPSLSGQFNINVDNGQFLKVDPGGGAKLLGLLSFQSLPRVLTLNFRDAFADGFAFDFIRGDVKVDQGLASTANLQMKGPQATVLMDGVTDLARETQDMRAVVVPEFNLGTGAILASIINPTYGLGTLLASLFLHNPVIKSHTYEYRIEGTWSAPTYTEVKLPSSKPAPSDNPPGSEVKP